MSSLIEGLNQRTKNLEEAIKQLTARIEALERETEVVISTVETATSKSIKKATENLGLEPPPSRGTL